MGGDASIKGVKSDRYISTIPPSSFRARPGNSCSHLLQGTNHEIWWLRNTSCGFPKRTTFANDNTPSFRVDSLYLYHTTKSTLNTAICHLRYAGLSPVHLMPRQDQVIKSQSQRLVCAFADVFHPAPNKGTHSRYFRFFCLYPVTLRLTICLGTTRSVLEML